MPAKQGNRRNLKQSESCTVDSTGNQVSGRRRGQGKGRGQGQGRGKGQFCQRKSSGGQQRTRGSEGGQLTRI